MAHRERGVARSLLLVGSTLALAIGCGVFTNGDGEPCADDDDCDGRCEWGYCTRGECEDDSDCPGGWSCEANGSGLLFGGGGRSCRPKCAGCPPTRQCRPGSDPTADCPASPLIDIKIDRTDELPVGVPVTLTANATSANGPIVAFQWSFADDGTGSTDPSVVHTFAVAGPSLVKLSVRDDKAATETASNQLVICQARLGACDWDVPCCSPATCSNGECLERPSTSAGGPYSGVAGEPITFHATASSPNGVPIVSYTWAVVRDSLAIERSISPSADFSYTFARGGNYEIDVRPTDDKGMEGHAEAPASICDAVGGGSECSVIRGHDSCCAPAKCSAEHRDIDGNVTRGTCY